MLTASGWAVQEKRNTNLAAARGVAVAELSFKTGEPDYSLFVDAKALGTVEAKPEGHSLVGVEEQSAKYVTGVPRGLPAWRYPLPFTYESTGAETWFTNGLDPDAPQPQPFRVSPPGDVARMGPAGKTACPAPSRVSAAQSGQPVAGTNPDHHESGKVLCRWPPPRAHSKGHRLRAKPLPPSISPIAS